MSLNILFFIDTYYGYNSNTEREIKGLFIGSSKSIWLADQAIAYLPEQSITVNHFENSKYFGFYCENGLAVFSHKRKT